MGETGLLNIKVDADIPVLENQSDGRSIHYRKVELGLWMEIENTELCGPRFGNK